MKLPTENKGIVIILLTVKLSMMHVTAPMIGCSLSQQQQNIQLQVLIVGMLS